MIMAAGISASRHFPELPMISPEGKTFFTRRIDPLSGSCDPMSSRSGYPLRHCCLGRPPSEPLPGIAARRRLFRDFQAEARISLDGPESGFGIGLRLCLALLPRSPRQSLPSVPALRPFPLSAVAAFPERLVVSDRPLLACKRKLCLFAESHKRILGVLRR